MRWLLAILVLSWPAVPLHAEETPATRSVPAQDDAAPPVEIDPEEQLDDGLKRFGYLAGLTRGCVTDQQRAPRNARGLSRSRARTSRSTP